jgi:hypothetical protein
VAADGRPAPGRAATGIVTLEIVVAQAKPTILIGTSTAHGAFTRQVVETMSASGQGQLPHQPDPPAREGTFPATWEGKRLVNSPTFSARLAISRGPPELPRPTSRGTRQ